MRCWRSISNASTATPNGCSPWRCWLTRAGRSSTSAARPSSTRCCGRSSRSTPWRRSRAASGRWAEGSECWPGYSAATTTPSATWRRRSRSNAGWADGRGSRTRTTTSRRRCWPAANQATANGPKSIATRRSTPTGRWAWRRGPHAPRRFGKGEHLPAAAPAVTEQGGERLPVGRRLHPRRAAPGGSETEEGSMSRKTLKTIATLGAISATAVVPAASAANTDLRSPDARDAGTAVVVNTGQDLRSPDARDARKVEAVNTGQDLRSPDARDAGKFEGVNTGQDLRSPDARDAGKVIATSNGQDLRSPDARDASRPNTSPVPSSAPSSGTDWGDVGMIGGAIALALLAAGGLIIVSRRRATVAPS